MTSKPLFSRPTLNPRRLPWGEDMTLCVAAECRRPDRFFNAIVFATDFQVEGDIAKAEIGKKLTIIGREDFPILIAGTQTRAVELASRVQWHLRQQSKEKQYWPQPWELVLEQAVHSQKQHIAQEITVGRFGLSYAEFLKIGKATFPEDVFREAVADIARATLDCWLLVMGFEQTSPRIFRVHPEAHVEECQNFAAIGSGYYIAESSLFQRSHKMDDSLADTIYHVYEAMRLGSKAPGVGEKFQIGVAVWEWWGTTDNSGSVQCSFLESEYYEYLSQRFAEFGPKEISNLEFKKEWIKEEEKAVVLNPKGEASELKRRRKSKRLASRRSKGRR